MRHPGSATGYRICLRPQLDTCDLVEIARRIIPREWRMAKPPSLHNDEGHVRVKVAAPPPPEEAAAVIARYDEETGFRLELD